MEIQVQNLLECARLGQNASTLDFACYMLLNMEHRLEYLLQEIQKEKTQQPCMLTETLQFDLRVYNPKYPPHRASKVFTTLRDEKDRHAFLTDLENECLKEYTGHCPKGILRYKNESWAAHMKKNLYPFHSDADWWDYVKFCEEGHGDEWFFDEEE